MTATPRDSDPENVDEIPVEEVEISKDADPESVRLAIIEEAKAARRGAFLGGLCILVGVLLLLSNAAGLTDLKINLPGASVELAGATPGVVVVVVGLLIQYVTRYKVKIS